MDQHELAEAIAKSRDEASTTFDLSRKGLTTLPPEIGDLILLCSDGLNSMVGDGGIERILKEITPKQVCQALIDAANDAGGHDNTTVAVATIGRARRSMAKLADQDTLKIKRGPSSFLKAWSFIIRRK